MKVAFKKKGGGTPMDAALNYLTSKARTEREMELKLDSLNFGEYEVYQTVERLKELGLIDDRKYAEDFVTSRLNTKPVSRRKLREQLYSHKLRQDVIDEALEQVTNEVEAANALAVTEKFARQFENLDPEERRQRVMRRLVGRGYDIAASKAAMEKVFSDADGIEDCVGEEDDDRY